MNHEDILQQATENAIPIQSSEWQEPAPVPTWKPNPPALTPDLIPEPLREWILDSSERIGGDPAGMLIPALASIATVIGNTLRIRPKNLDESWTEGPNLFGAIVGSPGSKKSPLLSEALRPLNRLQENAYEAHAATAAASKAKLHLNNVKQTQLTKALKDEGDPKEQARIQKELEGTFRVSEQGMPDVRRYMVNDITVPKLAMEMAKPVNRSGMLLLNDELTTVLAAMKTKGREGDRAFYLTAANGAQSYTQMRVDRNRPDLHIPRLTLSMVGGIQPAVLAPYVSSAVEGAGDDGFIERFQALVWLRDAQRGHNRPENKAARNRVDAMFDRLEESTREREGRLGPREYDAVTYSAAAQALVDDWWLDNEEAMRAAEFAGNPGLHAHLSKAEGYLARLILIIHAVAVADGATHGEVTEEEAYQGICLMSYLHEHAHITYNSFADQALNYQLSKLHAKLQDGSIPASITRRDFMRNHGQFASTTGELMPLLKAAEELNWLRLETVHSPGKRPSVTIRINPSFTS